MWGLQTDRKYDVPTVNSQIFLKFLFLMWEKTFEFFFIVMHLIIRFLKWIISKLPISKSL